jgi:hypothetical protein
MFPALAFRELVRNSMPDFNSHSGHYLVLDFDYFNKRTDNAYDFNVLLNTLRGVSHLVAKIKDRRGIPPLESDELQGPDGFHRRRPHTRALFPARDGRPVFQFGPAVRCIRIDHDQKFEQTTQVQYQFLRWKRLQPYINFTWRYDSGAVAGAVTDYATALGFTADQQAQIGLFCGSTFATPTQPIQSCTSNGSRRAASQIPADGTRK